MTSFEIIDILGYPARSDLKRNQPEDVYFNQLRLHKIVLKDFGALGKELFQKTLKVWINGYATKNFNPSSIVTE